MFELYIPMQRKKHSAQEMSDPRLLQAALRGDTKEAAQLLAEGADPAAFEFDPKLDHGDCGAMTTLTTAVEGGAAECVALLLPLRNMFAMDSDGFSPAAAARSTGRQDLKDLFAQEKSRLAAMEDKLHIESASADTSRNGPQGHSNQKTSHSRPRL